MKDGKWTTSENGEIYNGEEYDTREECLKKETEERMSIPNHSRSFWIGQIRECHTYEFVDCENLIEDAMCQAEDTAGEVAEDWLSYFPQKDKDELNELLVDWFEKKGYKPTFYAIKNSEEIVL